MPRILRKGLAEGVMLILLGLFRMRSVLRVNSITIFYWHVILGIYPRRSTKPVRSRWIAFCACFTVF